jgi:hypothetical protein
LFTASRLPHSSRHTLYVAALGGRSHAGLRFGFNFDRIQDFEGYGRFCREHNFAIAG